MDSLYSEILRLIYDNLFHVANFEEVNKILLLKTVNTRTCVIIKELFRSYLSLYRMRESRRVLGFFEAYLNKCSGQEVYDTFNSIRGTITPMLFLVRLQAGGQLARIFYTYNGQMYRCMVSTVDDVSTISINKIYDNDLKEVPQIKQSLIYQLSSKQYDPQMLSVGFNHAVYFQ